VQSTEHAVVQAARRCFARYGYRKTSMDDVAGDAGVAKGTVYLYCRNKQDLYVRAVEADLEAWLLGLRTALDDADRPAAELMVEMAVRDAAFVESHPLVSDLLTGDADAHVPDAGARLHELRQVGLGQVAAVLELGIAQGCFAEDLDVEATAAVLQQMQLAGALLHRRHDLSVAEVRRRQRAAMALVLRGLAPQPPA
jgi:AcrR family transcriptional regulator